MAIKSLKIISLKPQQILFAMHYIGKKLHELGEAIILKNSNKLKIKERI